VKVSGLKVLVDKPWCFLTVMAGPVPAIHAFGCSSKKDVDARDKPGHDA
jgi:hypothetical protein